MAARGRALVASGAPKYNDVKKCDSLKASRSGIYGAPELACAEQKNAKGIVI